MRAYERLIKYAKIHTTSDEESETCPSTPCQLDLARLLVDEMKGLGISDAAMDEFGYVYGTIPASAGLEDRPGLGFIAHMDTSGAAPGENVKPVLHENYDGGDVVLEGDTVISVERFPFLPDLRGETLITSDGTTLLGADDKAGIAEILTACEKIIAEGLPHPKLCIGFTPDEEIGRGADKFDIARFGAEYAYTVDGGDVGGIEYENFNAASAVVTFRGFSVHPGSAKDSMINAINVALEFHSALPAFERPEHTDGREGFYHAVHIEGETGEAKLVYILRDHDLDKLNQKKETMRLAAARLNDRYGAGTVTLAIRDSYLNMIEKIKPHFHLVEKAREAIRMTGLTPEELPVRGGTDGAVLSWKGLPCPNLGTGGFNFHGKAECITVERMDRATDVLLNIVKLYSE